MDVSVVAWDLEDTPRTPPGRTSAPEKSEEAIFEDDHRSVVEPNDVKTGGKLEGVLKIFIGFRTSKGFIWKSASGGLIQEDLLFTSGHCVWKHKPPEAPRRAVRIKVYCRYNGKDSVMNKDSEVEFRAGHQIFMPEGWMNKKALTYDAAFVKLKTPFEGVKPFHYRMTPERGPLTLGVVGYPADQECMGDIGAQMYQQFKENQSFNLTSARGNMLLHSVSTFGGQSGSPFLTPNISGTGYEVIGIHRGFSSTGENYASPIAGMYGNPFDAYIKAKEGVGVSPTRIRDGISYLDMRVHMAAQSHTPTSLSAQNELEASARSLFRRVKEIKNPDDAMLKKAEFYMAKAQACLSAAQRDTTTTPPLSPRQRKKKTAPASPQRRHRPGAMPATFSVQLDEPPRRRKT